MAYGWTPAVKKKFHSNTTATMRIMYVADILLFAISRTMYRQFGHATKATCRVAADKRSKYTLRPQIQPAL